MAKKRSHIISDIVKEVEATAKRIRADVRHMGKDARVGKAVARMAADLRKGAVHVGDQIDRYVREVQAEAKSAAKKATAKKRRPARKTAAKKRTAKRPAAKKVRKRAK